MQECKKLVAEIIESFENANKALEKLTSTFEKCRTEECGKVQLSELGVGEKFTTDLGTFIVLEQFGNETAVIMENLYTESKRFSGSSTDYNESEVKKLCDELADNEFARIFGADNIVEHEVDLLSVDGQQLYENPICKVRPLTFDEARKYNNILVNMDLGDCSWTCTSWSSKERGWEYSVAVVAPSGDISCSLYYGDFNGVRPFCILKSNIFVSKED